MDTIVRHYIPTVGGVFSVPVGIEHGVENGTRVLSEPENASYLVWNENGNKTPIARGSVAHLFCEDVPPSHSGGALGSFFYEDEYKLQILNTIQNIKQSDLPLTEWVSALSNGYTLANDNPYTLGCEVGLLHNNGESLERGMSFSYMNYDSGSVSAKYKTTDYFGWYVKLTKTETDGSGWVHDGIKRDNMYEAINNVNGVYYNVVVNPNKTSFELESVDSHNVECYRGLSFENDPINTGAIAARDILVLVDWSDTMEYTVFDHLDEGGIPVSRTITGPKAYFWIAWKNDNFMSERTAVTDDTTFSGNKSLDIYAPNPLSEFSFLPLSGGGGSGRKGKGGRSVTSSIPIRITSSGDVDYRHCLDLYDETNYPERNMFLTNFVGRIPYKLVDYDSSEAGGTGTIRVQTDLQFTHFVGASFTDDNVPRVYEVISHKSMGGSPNVLLCTFRVCYLKDYFQHFGVTAENEMLVNRSTYSGLYNPWLRDSRMFSEAVVEEGWDYGSGGFNFGLNSALVVLTDGRAVVLPIPAGSDPGYSHSVVPPAGDDPEYYFYGTSTFGGMLNCIEDVDADPLSSLYSTSFVNAVLSKIKAVYMVSSQMFSGGSATHVQMRVDMSYFTDPTDPENTLQKRVGVFDLLGYAVPNPEWPVSYTAGYLGSGSFSDWTDLDANYQMMIPWYGSCDISGVELKRVIDAGAGSIGVQYRVSALDGTITVAIGGSAGKIIRSWKPLPRLALPQSSRTLSYKQTNEQIRRDAEIRDDQTFFTSIASVATGLVSGGVALATGNPIAAAVAVGGGIAGAVGANISNDMRDRSSAIGSDIARTNITFNSTSCEGYEMLAIQTMRIIKVKKTEILNVYSSIGYPTRTLWRNAGAVNGYKYWVSILGTIRGTSAYAQAVRGEIERDGIIYNYS